MLYRRQLYSRLTCLIDIFSLFRGFDETSVNLLRQSDTALPPIPVPLFVPVSLRLQCMRSMSGFAAAVRANFSRHMFEDVDA